MYGARGYSTRFEINSTGIYAGSHIRSMYRPYTCQSEHAYTAQDYFSWDPFTEPPRSGLEILSECEVSKYRLMSNSLIHSFYADRVGLSLGCDFAEIFKWLPELRPYKSPTQLPWQEYIDQCYLITHVIFTCNNWGELRLDPALYPHEYHFLRANLDIHIQQRDVHLIAEFVESLRCFGCDDKDPLIRKYFFCFCCFCNRL